MEEQIKQARLEAQQRIASEAHRMIWISFNREGVHCYPAAGTEPDLEDVKFLAHPHRHIFHFKIYIEIEHNDREIEFIQFKRFCEGLFNEGILQLDHKSCEMISDDLYHKIAEKYPHREIWINVSEDNENGSEIRYHWYQNS